MVVMEREERRRGGDVCRDADGGRARELPVLMCAWEAGLSVFFLFRRCRADVTIGWPVGWLGCLLGVMNLGETARRKQLGYFNGLASTAVRYCGRGLLSSLMQVQLDFGNV